MRRLTRLTVVVAALVLGGVAALPAQAPTLMPISEVRPGMVGIGRTVFAGDVLEDFKVNVIGVLRNVMGPQRDLILAKLEGGPLATTGVIQGMSGSPVYIDGRLVGAVSYALGSFPREPIAGITPISEMIDAVNGTGPRVAAGLPVAPGPLTTEAVYASLARLAGRAGVPLGRLSDQARVLGPASLADLAPALRPIGAAMVFSGFDPAVDRDLRHALVVGSPDQSPADVVAFERAAASSSRRCRRHESGARRLRDGRDRYRHPPDRRSRLRVRPSVPQSRPDGVRDDARARLHGVAEPRLLDEDCDPRSGDRRDEPGPGDRRRRHHRRRAA